MEILPKEFSVGAISDQSLIPPHQLIDRWFVCLRFLNQISFMGPWRSMAVESLSGKQLRNK
jgi:hypothetical protein